MKIISLAVLLAAVFMGIDITLFCVENVQAAQARYTKVKRPVDIKMNGRVVAVVDENNSTVTIIGQPDVWTCAPHENGRSCRTSGDVTNWLLNNGEEGQ